VGPKLFVFDPDPVPDPDPTLNIYYPFVVTTLKAFK
jgi:hypothetical protein